MGMDNQHKHERRKNKEARVHMTPFTYNSRHCKLINSDTKQISGCLRDRKGQKDITKRQEKNF